MICQPPASRSLLRCLSCSLLFLIAVFALVPTAYGSHTRRGRSAAHRSIGHAVCALKRGKTAPTGRRSWHSCTQAAAATRAAASAPASGLPHATSLYGPVAASPTSASGATKGAPTPATTSSGVTETLPFSSSGVVSDPIDPRFLTNLGFGTVSFWIEPWRAYLDTWPASHLLESVGINFNVNPTEAEDTAQLLQDSGFKLARREIGWGAMSYSNPTSFEREAHFVDELTAMHRHGLRPLLLLNANSGAPGPAKKVNLETTVEAPIGAATVTLTPESAAQVVPGKTGFDQLAFGGNPDILIRSVGPGNVASLSRPLTSALPAGAHKGTTLRYAPFAAPILATGQPNPVYQETLAGWLSYVDTVSKTAASIVGPGGFDLEIWNELSFGSQFLNYQHYYTLLPENPLEEAYEPGGKSLVAKEILRDLLAATVAYVRDPQNGISPSVGITDGFASQTPFPSGAGAPVGMTALSKHPYMGPRTYPIDYREASLRPVNALGLFDTLAGWPFKPLFIPSYQADMPESSINGLRTENLLRDVAPFVTNIYGYPHGRTVAPEGGQPLQKWITEYNLGSTGATIMGPDGVTPEPSATLTPADRAHFMAKADLRSLIAQVGKGFSREYFFGANPGGLGLVSQTFMNAVDASPGTYPGDALGGEVMSGFRNLLARFAGPGPTGGVARQLALQSISQEGNHAQFTGDGTPAHPSLYDREVLAVLPFQASDTRFVIPVYVMTRDLMTLYQPLASSSDVTRFDLPDERFQITLGNLPATTAAPAVSAYDPLRDAATPARLVSRSGSTAVFEVAASDYPRLLTVDYTGK